MKWTKRNRRAELLFKLLLAAKSPATAETARQLAEKYRAEAERADLFDGETSKQTTMLIARIVANLWQPDLKRVPVELAAHLVASAACLVDGQTAATQRGISESWCRDRWANLDRAANDYMRAMTDYVICFVSSSTAPGGGRFGDDEFPAPPLPSGGGCGTESARVQSAQREMMIAVDNVKSACGIGAGPDGPPLNQPWPRPPAH